MARALQLQVLVAVAVRHRKHRRVDRRSGRCLRERGRSTGRDASRCRLAQRIAAHEDEREAGGRHPNLIGVDIQVACDLSPCGDSHTA